MASFRLIRTEEGKPARATAEDLADAAVLGPDQGAARLMRRRLLRALAAETLGVHPDTVAIERLPTGGLRIAGPERLYASVSGRDGWTALGLAVHPVGVDVETYPPQDPPAFDLLHPLEQETILDDANPRRLFLRFWAAREAYLKAKGRGFDVMPSQVRAARRDAEVALIEPGQPVAIARIMERDEAIAAIVELAEGA